MRKLLLLLFFLPSLSFSQSTIESEVKEIAKDYLKNKPGALIIGVRKGGLNKIYYFGETKDGSKQLPDNNSLFELGEVTEIFTTALYSELLFENVITPEDPLQKFLPENVIVPQYSKIICEPVDEDVPFDKERGIHFSPQVCRPDTSFSPQPILLCYLANHTSGLPELPDNIDRKKEDAFNNYSQDDLLQFLKSYQFVNKIEFNYRHSTLGMGILGVAMELKTGKSYQQLLDEKIFRPLGIISSPKPIILTGYDAKGRTVINQHYGALKAGKGLSLNISDMMKILEASMLSEKSHVSDLLIINQKSRIKSGGKEYALGWEIKKLNNKTVTFQKGTTNGFASWIGLLGEERMGVVILSSIAKNADDAGEEVLKLMMK